jgi:hypothetical protein
MNKDLTRKLVCLENLIGIQRDCVDNRDPNVEYMHGMLNGLICAHAILADSSPRYHSRPRYRRDRRDKHVRHKSLHNRTRER